MTDEVIIQEAIRLVNDGLSVTFPVKGRSMLPFIIGGEESVILKRPTLIDIGDVVLALVEGQRYVVHRITAIDGARLTLMGDGNVAGTEHCMVSDVRALATHVVDAKGRQHPLYSPWRLRAAKVWRGLLPIRRLLLIVYKLIRLIQGKRLKS